VSQVATRGVEARGVEARKARIYSTLKLSSGWRCLNDTVEPRERVVPRDSVEFEAH